LARKILLADDSVTAQNMGRKILTDAGYEVTTVNNGSAALKKVAEHKPDLIVLDVYMPGYSGLEVCQRIKETKETSRIPILLTVGKLEPFKPEEARKARADAYIVKPFEASELLVALTKLEDKIVPQAEPYKPGRFAKAIAAAERFNDGEESFGDKDSGWKNRIKFPSGPPKPAEREPEELLAGKKSFREGEKPAEPNRAFERPIPEGLPKDITAEEIEAITAAAAQFTGGEKTPSTYHTPPPPRPHETSRDRARESDAAMASESDRKVEVAAPPPPAAADANPAITEQTHEEEESPVTLAGGSQVDAESEDQRAELPPTTEPGGPVAAAGLPERPAEIVAQQEGGNEIGEANDRKEGFTLPESLTAMRPEAATHAPVEADAEVTAAVQSLSPGNGNGTSELPATAAAGAGPRWVAEPVSLDSHEASVVLEKEMHKAFAAFAAADDAKATFAMTEAPSRDFAGASMASAVAEEYAASQPQASPYAHEFRSEMPAQPNAPVAESSAEVTPPPSMPSASDAVAIDAESTMAAEGAGSTEGEQKREEPERAELVSPSSDWQPVETSAPQTTQSATPEETKPGEGPKGDPQDTATRAAAWENWKHIRDTVMGSTADLGDVAAAALSNTSQDEPSTKPEAMAAAASAGSAASTGSASSLSEGDAIANIVDSVLAELKPKLMEEIAKKMKKGSK